MHVAILSILINQSLLILFTFLKKLSDTYAYSKRFYGSTMFPDVREEAYITINAHAHHHEQSLKHTNSMPL